jgi:hypothetical protein
MQHSKYEAKSHTSYNNSLIKVRFKVFLFLLRMGGIPFQMKSISRLNVVYNASIFVGFYITNICAGLDTFSHRQDLTLAMKSFRQYLGMLMTAWLHFCLR